MGKLGPRARRQKSMTCTRRLEFEVLLNLTLAWRQAADLSAHDLHTVPKTLANTWAWVMVSPKSPKKKKKKKWLPQDESASWKTKETFTSFHTPEISPIPVHGPTH